MYFKQCEKCGQWTAWAGIGTNLILVTLKVIVGVTSGSKACIADGLHSASNIITAFAILLSQRIGRKQVNARFPYGFGKIEFVAAGAVSLLITAGAVTLITVTIKHLLSEPSPPPHFSALLMAFISIGTNEMLFRYMRCAGSQVKSQTILANAWANRADSVSSLVVILGVVGSRLGIHHLDPIAALLVVAVIIKVSVKILVNSVKALMDSSVNDEYGEDIRSIVEDVEDVQTVASIKTRQIGQKIWVELDILIDSRCTIRQGHQIAEKVKASLLEKMIDLEKVLVNFRPLEQEG